MGGAFEKGADDSVTVETGTIPWMVWALSAWKSKLPL
jgi:hypothetical protein